MAIVDKYISHITPLGSSDTYKIRAIKLGSADVGSTTQPIYLDNGEPKVINHAIEANISSGTANQVAYYSSTDTIASKAPEWKAWVAGSTAGPQAKIQIGNVDYTSAAIPSASATASGVVTTGNQTFAGKKTINLINPHIYDGTGNSSRYRYIYFNNSEGDSSVSYIRYDSGNATNVTSGKFLFLQKSYDSTTASPNPLSTYEAYYLPTVTANLDESKTYNILTTKNPVTIAQGGTGEITARTGLHALTAGLTEGPATTLTDNTYFIRGNTNGAINDWYLSKGSVLWDYIKGHITNDLYWANIKVQDSSKTDTIPTFKTIYFGTTDPTASGRGILTFSSTYPNYGLWYFHNSSGIDIITLDGHGKANSKTEADLAINALGAGIISTRNRYIPHTNNTTGTVGTQYIPVYVNAGTITQITANSVLTDLASTTAASTYAASPRPGITGTLPIDHGGTNATTELGARQNLDVPQEDVISYFSSAAKHYIETSLTCGSSNFFIGFRIWAESSYSAKKPSLIMGSSYWYANDNTFTNAVYYDATKNLDGIELIVGDDNKLFIALDPPSTYQRYRVFVYYSTNRYRNYAVEATQTAPTVIKTEPMTRVSNYSALKIDPAGTTAQFWRGDNTWTNELSGGQLKITNHSNTVTIGPGNTSYTHFNNSADIPFYFNKSIWVDGDLYPYGTSNTRSLGSSSKRWKSLLIGTADSYGGTTQPIWWNAGVPTAITTAIATAYGGTGNTSYTAHRLIYTNTATKFATGTIESDGNNIILGDGDYSLSRTARSGNWNQGVSKALIKITSATGAYPLFAMKSHSGHWLMTEYESSGFYDHLIFGFLSDVDVYGVTNAKNHYDYKVRLIPTVYATNTETVTDRAFVTAEYASNSAKTGDSNLPVYINASGVATTVTAQATANNLINALSTGSSTPVDADYYISQYVGGGTTTTTYHRRPMSALWAYIKGHITSDLYWANIKVQDSSKTDTIPTFKTIYFGTTDPTTSGRGILTFSSTYPNHGLWYFNDSTDIITLDGHGKANSKTEADLAINALGAGIISTRNRYIPHTNNTTGTVGTATKPVYVNAGVITEGSYELKATVNAGAANRAAYYSGERAISQASSIYMTTSALGVNQTSITSGQTFEVTGKAHINNTTSNSGTTATPPAFSVGTLTGTNIGMSPTGIQAKNNATTSTLNLNWYGGSVVIGQPSTPAQTTINGLLLLNRTDVTYATTNRGTLIPLIQMKYNNTGSGIYTKDILAAIETAETGANVDQASIFLGSQGGSLILGAGESAAAVQKNNNLNQDENIYLIADTGTRFYVNANIAANAKHEVTIDTAGLTIEQNYLRMRPYSATYNEAGADSLGSIFFNHDRANYPADTFITGNSIRAARFIVKHDHLVGDAPSAAKTVEGIKWTDNNNVLMSRIMSYKWKDNATHHGLYFDLRSAASTTHTNIFSLHADDSLSDIYYISLHRRVNTSLHISATAGYTADGANGAGSTLYNNGVLYLNSAAGSWSYIRLNNNSNKFDIATKTNDSSGALQFRPNGEATYATTMNTTGDWTFKGFLYPATNNAYGLGADLFRWTKGFFTTAVHVGAALSSGSSTTASAELAPAFVISNQDTNSTGGTYVRGKGTNYLRGYISALGEANTQGELILQLGNGSDVTADKNGRGRIRFYGTGTKYIDLIPAQTGTNGNYTQYLPQFSGYSVTHQTTLHATMASDYTAANWNAGTQYIVGSGTTGAAYITDIARIARRVYEDGTAGYSQILLGNTLANGTGGNAYGSLVLYGTNASYTNLRANPNGNRTMYLPYYGATGYLTCVTGTTAVGNSYTPAYVAANNVIQACSPMVIYSTASNTAASGQPARLQAALQSIMPTHNNSRPEAFYLNTNNGSVAFGYTLSGDSYNTVATAYGGYFIAHYNIPRYQGISGGTWSNRTIVTNATNAQIGNATTPVYVDANGVVQTCTPYGSGTASTANALKTTLMTNASTAIYVLGATGTSADTSATVYKAYRTTTAQVYFRGDTGVLMGAAWNDYAEYRQSKDDIEIEPGRVVKEVGDETLELATERLQRGCSIVSNTFGISIGESETNKLPLAVAGRVLAYPYESREEFREHIGWPVCSGPNGTVSIMTEEEEMKYPSRIIGTISAVPDYEIWHGGADVIVNGRVWIKVR